MSARACATQALGWAQPRSRSPKVREETSGLLSSHVLADAPQQCYFLCRDELPEASAHAPRAALFPTAHVVAHTLHWGCSRRLQTRAGRGQDVPLDGGAASGRQTGAQQPSAKPVRKSKVARGPGSHRSRQLGLDGDSELRRPSLASRCDRAQRTEGRRLRTAQNMGKTIRSESDCSAGDATSQLTSGRNCIRTRKTRDTLPSGVLLKIQQLSATLQHGLGLLWSPPHSKDCSSLSTRDLD